MAELILGPMLRYVSETEATVFVETDTPTEVAILGASAPTFEIEGHHYALVQIADLERGSVNPYEVALDGERAWPPEDYELPAPEIRTFEPGHETIDIAFGSCRVALPHEPPWTLSKDEDDRGRELDALYVLAREMLGGDAERWPDMLLMLGDQVYVDEGSLEVRERIRARRDTSQAPGEEVADFEEYTWLYREAWADPLIRWIFSTVSVSMTWDDHDIHDDWNISAAWCEDMEREDWWGERLIAGRMSYWIYQHIGNLSPRELADNEIFQKVNESDDRGESLRRHCERIAETGAGKRWSYYRDIGKTRLIVMDSRGGRVLREGERSIFDEEEWEWIVDHANGDFDHLLLGTSDPFLLTGGLHFLEAWNERVSGGAWGGIAAKLAEKLRRALDFDHWAAFGRSFGLLADLLAEIGRGERGTAPASIVVLSGDVHHAYLSEVGFRPRDGVGSRVWQAVVSPMRNSLEHSERRMIEATQTRAGREFTRALAHAAGVEDPPIGWRMREGPHYDNQIGTLSIKGRDASMKLEKTNPSDERDERRLETVFERDLT